MNKYYGLVGVCLLGTGLGIYVGLAVSHCVRTGWCGLAWIMQAWGLR